MKRITVQVTKLDIRRGKQTDCTNCPVARAVYRALGYRHHVYIGGKIEVDFNPVETPLKVETFIETFDQDPRRARPFKFCLKLP